MITRRKFLQWSTLIGLLPSFAKAGNQTAETHVANQDADTAKHQLNYDHHNEMMAKYKDFTDGKKLKIAMLVYPGMFLQDLVGPLAMFESLMNREIYLVWKDKKPVGNQDPVHPTMIPVQATTTFEECPNDLDVLFVPGGVPGTFNMMEDQEVIGFLQKQAKTAKYITSVCTGSLILGAAGLLKGYKATTHWATFDALKELGAIPTKQRIVEDRNRITGGGVTAGMDFGLLIIARLRNQSYAEATQLYLEYDPQPPFNSGTPEKAPPLVNQFLKEMFAPMRQKSIDVSKRVFEILS
jgi:cyclohexyl-isocyanide hydratase